MNAARKVAVVTGSATGIGRAVALRLAGQGFAVAVNYSRSEADAANTVAEVQKLGVPALLCKANVGREAEVRAMFAQVQADFGGVDVLVNNAGTTRFIDHKDLASLTEAVWDEILAVNVKGTYFCSREAVPQMQARGGGAIVNVTSVAGLSGVGSSIAYAASKGAINTMTRSFARAFAPAIRVNAVAPGPVLTRWLAPHMDHVEKQMHLTPMGRAATPDDIADAVVFLCTGTSLMTGQVIVVDGGRTM